MQTSLDLARSLTAWNVPTGTIVPRLQTNHLRAHAVRTVATELNGRSLARSGGLATCPMQLRSRIADCAFQGCTVTRPDSHGRGESAIPATTAWRVHQRPNRPSPGHRDGLTPLKGTGPSLLSTATFVRRGAIARKEASSPSLVRLVAI